MYKNMFVNRNLTMTYRLHTLFCLSLLLGFISCLKEPDDMVINDPLNPEQLNIGQEFDFATTVNDVFTIKVLDQDGEALAKVPLNISFEKPTSDTSWVLQGITDVQGSFSADLTRPSFTDSVYVQLSYIGLPQYYQLNVASGNSEYLLGDLDTYDEVTVMDNFVLDDPESQRLGRLTSPVVSRNRLIDFTFMGEFDRNGVPQYLEQERFKVNSDLLEIINASLPEGTRVPDRNPEYITDGVQSDVRLRALADVWITFVHEGAGYKNVLGFYTYRLDNPPQSVDDIANLTIIFPNLSYKGSGGGLRSGDQVYLGRFSSNTGIGWFLIPDGYNLGAGRVEEKDQIKFSNKDFNTFTQEQFISHVVLLKDEARELLLIGMEDISRPGGDNDFNDAVFFVTATPYEAIIREEVPDVIQAPLDTDNDGVNDEFDQYPNDPSKSFDSYFPGKGQFGTLAFEDFWPRKGDFDFNDMVVQYNYQYQTDAVGRVTEINATYRLEAMGAGFRNGFGIQLDVNSNAVSSVEGVKYVHNIISQASNGVEAGQDKATIIAFDDGYGLLSAPDGGFVNTDVSKPYINPKEITVNINFQTPQTSSDLGVPPYNPFIFTDKRRGYEIHLPDHPPTSKVDFSIFGTEEDDSNPGINRYYKTSNNMMWAIHFPLPFSYPKERISIFNAYPKFEEWAENNGVIFKDWYSNTSNGYRVNGNLYTR